MYVIISSSSSSFTSSPLPFLILLLILLSSSSLVLSPSPFPPPPPIPILIFPLLSNSPSFSLSHYLQCVDFIFRWLTSFSPSFCVLKKMATGNSRHALRIIPRAYDSRRKNKKVLSTATSISFLRRF